MGLREIIGTLIISRSAKFINLGYRKYHSTYMASITLIDKLINAVCNSKHVDSLFFLDFSQAFDIVENEKMSFSCIRGPVLLWFGKYLYNQNSCVAYDGVHSDTSIVKCGVLEGSILGPLLISIPENGFCLYMCQISAHRFHEVHSCI